MLPVLIALGILIQLACIHFTGEGRFLTAQNLSIMAQQASINTVLAAGMTFVILTGGIDLSVGSILAAAAMVGMIVSKEAGLIGVPAAMLTGLLFGVINGALIAYMRLPPFIVTLGSLTPCEVLPAWSATTLRCSIRNCHSPLSATARSRSFQESSRFLVWR
jgi:ribose transport system permease protein